MQNGHHEWWNDLATVGVGMTNDQAVALAVVDAYTRRVFGVGSHVVGGYVRDVLFGVQPGDMDIGCCCGDRDPADMFAAAEGLVAALSPLTYHIEISQSYDNASGDFNDRVHILIQATLLSGGELDIIWYKDYSWHGVFEHYDSNINKCIMGAAREPFYWDSIELPKEVVTYKPLTTQRVKRLKEIAEHLGLPFDTGQVQYIEYDFPEDLPF